MDGAAPSLWLACLMGAGGVAVLRYAWSRQVRSAGWTGAGWALLLAAVVCGWQQAGAWGVSIVTLIATGAAFVALAVAAARAPQGRTAPVARRSTPLPVAEPRRIGRRIATFVIVVLGGAGAALMLALALRSLGILSGWGAANANVAALYAVPLVWAGLATALLMQGERRTQIVTIAACLLAALPFLFIGGGS